MRGLLAPSLLALPLALAFAPDGAAAVTGRGSKKADCFAEFEGITASRKTGVPPRERVDCTDGDPSCDADGQRNNQCTFSFQVCAMVEDPSLRKCHPESVTGFPRNDVLVRRRRQGGLTTPAVPATTKTCAEASNVVVALKKGGTKAGRVKVALTATSSGKPKADKNVFFLRCKPCKPGQPCQSQSCPTQGPATATDCPANAAGGPSELVMESVLDGSDLDTGWTGISQGFPVTPNSTLKLCLSGCDGTAGGALCTMDGKTGAGTPNGRYFGAPLPLLSGGTPVCLVNRFDGDVTGTANPVTGEIVAHVNLFSDVYAATPANQVCPRCTGGTCDSGANSGKSCTVDGTMDVTQSVPLIGSRSYALSRDCPPSGAPNGSLKIPLDPFTTAQAAPITSQTCRGLPLGPCAFTPKDDNCGAQGCGAPCADQGCIKRIPDPTDANGALICVDSKGGMNQVCCNGNPALPCFPTGGGGQILRNGLAHAPTAATATQSCSIGTLAATFCIPFLNNCVVVGVAGLPGPGALILPFKSGWLK